MDEPKVKKLIKENKNSLWLGCGCFSLVALIALWVIYATFFRNTDAYGSTADEMNQEVFIEFIENDLSKEIAFDLELSKIKTYEDSDYYIMEAEIENKAKTLWYITCATSFFDEHKNFIDSVHKVFCHLNYEPIKKGDKIPIWQFLNMEQQFFGQAFKYAEVEVIKLGTYDHEMIFDDKETPLPISWSFPKPKNVQIDAYKRTYLDGEQPDSSLILTYTGRWPIPYFTYQLQWTLIDHTQVQSDTINIGQYVSNNFRPNTQRVCRLISRPFVENTDSIIETRVIITDCRFE